MTNKQKKSLATKLKSLRSGKTAEGKKLKKKGAKIAAAQLLKHRMISASEAAKHGVGSAAKKPAKAAKTSAKKPAKKSAKGRVRHTPFTKKQYVHAISMLKKNLYAIARHHGAPDMWAKMFVRHVMDKFDDEIKQLEGHIASLRAHEAQKQHALIEARANKLAAAKFAADLKKQGKKPGWTIGA